MNNVVLDIFIGLVFVYVLYSLFTTIISELIASLFNLRAQMLKRAIKRMLTDEGKTTLERKLYDSFFDHPLIKYMSSGLLKREPSFISSQSFSKSILDILKDYESVDASVSLQKINEKLDELGKAPGKNSWSSDTINLIKSFLNDANNDLEGFKESIGKWFDDTMETTSAWYKRQSQLIVLFIGLILAMSFNVDTLEIVSRLSKDKIAREQIVQIATNYVNDRQPSNDVNYNKRLDSLAIHADSLYKTDIAPVNEIIGLGWWTFGFSNLIGCILTALAISLGAPFWFDLLSKLVQLRGTGPKSEEGKQTKKEDKSTPAVKPVG